MGLADKMKKKAEETKLDDRALEKLKEMRKGRHRDEDNDIA